MGMRAAMPTWHLQNPCELVESIVMYEFVANM
jgi:hypothetical protein